jgi:hypothetical protein
MYLLAPQLMVEYLPDGRRHNFMILFFCVALCFLVEIASLFWTGLINIITD